MKNTKSLFIALFLLTATTLSAQTNRFSLGIEGGPSLVSLWGNEMLRKNHKPGMSFSSGLFFQYNISKLISLRTNISFERKGSKQTIGITDENGNSLGNGVFRTNMDYLTIPLLVRATAGEKLKYFINAGPYFGYLLEQTVVLKTDNFPKMTLGDDMQIIAHDLGLTTGLGVSIPLKTTFSLSFELRNNLGLINLSEVPVYREGSIKTNSTNFLFAFAYNFGQ